MGDKKLVWILKSKDAFDIILHVPVFLIFCVIRVSCKNVNKLVNIR